MIDLYFILLLLYSIVNCIFDLLGKTHWVTWHGMFWFFFMYYNLFQLCFLFKCSVKIFELCGLWQKCFIILKDQGGYDVACLEDWIFRVPQVSLYLEMLVAEGLNVWPSVRPALPLLPPCKETPWKDLRCLLDIPTLMFLAPQVSVWHTVVRITLLLHLDSLEFCVFSRRCK